MSENNTNDLNEQVEVTVHDAEVVTVPIDATLSNSGEAADAKAVGDALALKADADAVVAIKVNGQAADNQGLILIDGSEIPVSGTNTKKISEVLENVTAKTAENIPMSSDPNAKTIAEVVNENAEAIENMQDKTAANIPMDTGSSTTIKVAIESLDQKTVKTINKKGPDADGDVDMSVVPLAENLQSDKMQSIEGAFIQRTSGGNGSVSDGKAYPLHIFGHMERTGYVAEDLDMTVIPMPRTEPDEPITAEIDRDTFVAYVEESGTIDLFYTTEWSADPELYGVTVTGTPVAGDQIKIVYVKEERGTILVAKPERLVATGWNLYNINKGYAKVVRYSSEYGYKIGGGYSSLTFSTTLTGERASITPSANGLFNVPGNGYVFVNGGNGTDTYILATWSDWQDGPSTGYWEPYKESGITLNSVIETYLPNGVLAIGTVRDEIDFSAKRAISRIDRMTYSEENLAAAIATGRDYIYDEDYIYIVREEAVINAITIDSEYTVSEHGLEYFTETVMPLGTEILYGKNLRDKLERDVLTISAQTLTAEEQAQARKNIGAMNPPGNNGTEGQLLKTNGDGSTSWTNQGTPSDAQVGTAVSAWLNAHPEATTTVQDGAVSRAKLDADLKEKTDKVATLESAIEAETEERKSRDNQLQEKIDLEAGYRKNADDEIKSDLVPFPVYPDSKHGTSGQVLRTKGDGKTEWADVGLPTDEQTAEAIEAWLDDHPEATTTVQDGSLNDAKFTETLKYQTENDYIIPEMYGAAGDGTTDDASALQSAINYAIANNKPLKLSDGKTYGVSTGLMISGGWLEIKKSTGIIKALNAIDGAVVTIISPNIISDREEIGKRRVLSFNLECNGSSKGIFGHGMFEYIVRDSLIKGAIIGIDMNSPCAEVIFENCYIDGNGISNSTGVLNRAADIVYKNLYMFNCHTAFDITAFCELYNCHPWMDRNIDGSIGIKTTVTCKIADSYIDTYQKSIYKSNGANMLLDNTYIYISNEFYTSDLGPAYIFYAENNGDYNYSLLSNLFIAKGGDSITVKLSNLTSFNIAMSNCRIETGIDKSMRTTSTQLKTSNAPLASVSSGVTLREQYGAQNEYGRYIMFVIDVGSSDVNAWANVATIASGSYTPKYTATLVGVREDTGNAVLLYANTNGQITTSRNLIAGKKYRISGVFLA